MIFLSTNLTRQKEDKNETKEDLPSIIGGDFNIDTTDMQPLEGFIVPMYEQSTRSLERNTEPNFIPYKDNFLFSHHGNHLQKRISLRYTRPYVLFGDESNDLSVWQHVNIEDIEREMDELNVDGTTRDLLDHDPIISVLSLDKLFSKLYQCNKTSDNGKYINQ